MFWNKKKAAPVDEGRRQFIQKMVGWTGLGAFLLGSGAAAVRFLSPNVKYEPPSQFKVGKPSDFAVGSARNFGAEHFFLFRSKEGMYAISTVCTHLGCIVSKQPDKFVCPCHGTDFSPEGKVLSGPAPAPLPWFKVSLAPDGSVLVDTSAKVPTGTYFDPFQKKS
jgi:cytochrome b6-f complex iron-sulfur subunit